MAIQDWRRWEMRGQGNSWRIALGSVRQLVEEEGMVALAKSYDPYGGVIGSSGSGEAAYGFIDEMINTIKGAISTTRQVLRRNAYPGAEA